MKVRGTFDTHFLPDYEVGARGREEIGVFFFGVVVKCTAVST